MTYKKIMFGLFLGHEIIVKGILGQIDDFELLKVLEIKHIQTSLWEKVVNIEDGR